MLLPDTKWDRKDASALYTLAILKDPALKSVRDLRGAHVPMLKQLRAGVLAAHATNGVITIYSARKCS